MLFLGVLLFPLCMSGQDPSMIRFVSKGKMVILPNTGTTLYVPQSMEMLPGAEITQKGRTVLGGDFIHNATGTVFTTNYANLVDITGVFSFSGTSGYVQKLTSTLTPYDPQDGVPNNGMMNKTNMFLAFPNMEVANKVKVTPQMGISTKNLEFKGANMLLESDPNGVKEGNAWIKSKDQDASLLVYGTVNGYGTEGNKGYMEIERVVKANFGKIVTAASNQIGFSAPLSNMYLDYFSDHWVYDPQAKKYLTARNAQFEPGKGYFVLIRELSGQSEHPEDNVEDDLYIQNTKFVLARNYYEDFLSRYGSWLPVADKVRPQEKLLTSNIPVSLKSGDNYLGNPYTCAIDMEKMFTAWGETWDTSTSSRFEKSIKVWDARASNFISATPGLSALDEGQEVIPSQQLFLVTAKQDIASLQIPAVARVHNAHRFLKSAGNYDNEIMLEVSENLLGTYSRLVAGFRTWGTDNGNDPSDASFTPSLSGLSPMLYTTASDGKQLSISAIPFGAKYMDVSFIAADSLRGERMYSLRASRQESLSSESVLLVDKFTGEEIDLFQTPVYEFSAKAKDLQDRFRIVFAPSLINREEMEELSQKTIYNRGNNLFLDNFRDSDTGQIFRVYNATGMIVYQNRIIHAGTNMYELSLTPGIYIVKYGTLTAKIKL